GGRAREGDAAVARTGPRWLGDGPDPPGRSHETGERRGDDRDVHLRAEPLEQIRRSVDGVRQGLRVAALDRVGRPYGDLAQRTEAARLVRRRRREPGEEEARRRRLTGPTRHQMDTARQRAGLDA